MSNDSGIAEDIVDSLMAMSCVDNYDLAVHAFDQLDEKDRKKFVGFIKEDYDLFTIDEAREAIANDY